MKAQWFNQVSQIGEARWQQAIGDMSYPFAQYGFFHALETSQSVGEESGWYPEYLLLMEDDDTPIAIAPTFLKTHSQGEFVFDWSWAEAYQKHGLDYFPKRIWAVPFSPVTGPRLFSGLDSTTQSEELDHLHLLVAQVLTDRTSEQKLSSWHLLFNQANRLEGLKSEFLLHRTACQFHWFNRDFQNMEDYFAKFSSRKRKTAKKERKKVLDQGLSLTRKLGKDLSKEEIDFFYICYQSTYAKRGQQGYLTRDFFQNLISSMGDQILLVLASRGDDWIAASWCFFDDHSLYGRYWGCVEEFDCLHFEACYYQGIEFCLEQGLQHFDPGTQGEHKIARGFEPVYSHSLHYIAHPGFRDAIAQFCVEEGKAVDLYKADIEQQLPFKKADS